MTTMMMMTVDNHQERETKDNIIVQNTRVLFCWIDALSLSYLFFFFNCFLFFFFSNLLFF